MGLVKLTSRPLRGGLEAVLDHMDVTQSIMTVMKPP